MAEGRGRWHLVGAWFHAYRLRPSSPTPPTPWPPAYRGSDRAAASSLIRRRLDRRIAAAGIVGRGPSNGGSSAASAPDRFSTELGAVGLRHSVEIRDDRPGQRHACNSHGNTRRTAMISRLSRCNSAADPGAVRRNSPGLFAHPKYHRHCPREPAGTSEADLLGQLAPRRYFRRLTAPDAATREVPLGAVRRAHQQQRPTDADCYKGSLVALSPALSCVG